jgi:hypothetical protein
VVTPMLRSIPGIANGSTTSWPVHFEVHLMHLA